MSVLGFTPKENAVGIFQKIYVQNNGYLIEIDTKNQRIHYGDKIRCDSQTTQNFSQPENFQLRKFTKADLKELTEAEGKKLFNEFASILRKHSVSDKPNAFNVIFNLFLAKLYDEAKRDTDELEFHWREDDDPVDFQVRLYRLHKNGLYEFLKKEIEGIEDADFKADNSDELRKAKKKFLKFNKLFDIKSVLDDNDFEQNHRVLKEVVQLLEQYQIRYPRKQRYLSEFFELLLTTGLKQEAGQYFTPPPVAKFIIKSLPLKSMVEQEANQEVPKLPAVIDYAAGSGHFITEILEEYQDIINDLDTKKYYPKAISEVNGWKVNPYSWAATYVYGIEKDYRLVNAKVGCYFYGDGLAQVVHGDGLDSLINPPKSYAGLLEQNTNTTDSSKNKFSVIVSNPPYSVEDVKDDLEYIGAQDEFSLYKYLTDNSDDIECLFVERTKQLLKDGGVAGIIFPSSILNNTGIYTKAREIILQYFDIVAIAQFGDKAFMATNTKTVVLFLRRRSDAIVQRIKKSAYHIAENYPKTHEDLTIYGIEKPVKKYIEHTGETEVDPEKFYYFVLAYPQKNVVVINSGQKNDEKLFLGYYFSDTRGSEGMHPVNRRSTIENCTKLFDNKSLNNPQKASTYIHNAFIGNDVLEIDETLKNNVSYVDLVDMLTFNRKDFDKSLVFNVKKKIKISTKWNEIEFGKVADIIRGITYSKSDQILESTPNIVLTADNVTLGGSFELKKEIYLQEDFNVPEEKILKKNDIFMCFSSGSKEHLGKVAFIENDTNYLAGGFMGIIRAKENVMSKYLFQLLNSVLRQQIRDLGTGSNINNLSGIINEIKIPLPPKEIQEKIVAEIEVLEKKETKAKEKVKKLKNEIEQKFTDVNLKADRTLRLLDDKNFDISIGKRVLSDEVVINGEIPVFSANVFAPFGYVNKLLIEDFSTPSVLWGIDGDWMVNFMPANKPFYPTDHCGVLRVIGNEILPKYLSWILNKEGIAFGFSRTLRASIDRIKGIKIKVPPLSEQQKIVSEIEKIETQISELEQQLAEFPKQKEEILKKYL